jgi:E3 ubiquitin-protein ligase BRE1
LEEERDAERQQMAERDEALLLCERKNRRLELEIAKQTLKSEELTGDVAEAPQPQQVEKSVLAELEAFKTLAAQRLVEIEKVERERADVRYENVKLQEQIRKLPDDAFRDPRTLKDLRGEIQHLRQELSRQRKSLQYLEDELHGSTSNKQLIINELEGTIKGKLLDMKKFIDGVESDASRIRKERDQMRELYEQVNGQVAAANRQNSNLQLLLTKSDERLRICEKQEARNSKIFQLLQSISEASRDGQVAAMSQTIEQLKNDEQVLYSELEVIGKAFEDLKEQNSLLIKQIAEKEEGSAKLLGEKLKAEFALVQAKKDTEISLQKALALERASLERLEAAEARERQARSRIIDAETRLGQNAVDLEKLQSRTAELAGDNASLKARLDRFIAVNYDQVIADKARALEATQYEKKRMTEEMEILQKRLRGYMESGKGPQKDLEEEIAIYKKLMKCNSCHIRDKNAVITKCMHVFCRQCLDTRIETRQRKCPNCGEAFGANDVRHIYL